MTLSPPPTHIVKLWIYKGLLLSSLSLFLLCFTLFSLSLSLSITPKTHDSQLMSVSSTNLSFSQSTFKYFPAPHYTVRTTVQFQLSLPLKVADPRVTICASDIKVITMMRQVQHIQYPIQT